MPDESLRLSRMSAEEITDEAEAKHEQRIIDDRARLWEDLAQAEAVLKRAVTTYRRLAVGNSRDVEYENVPEFSSHLQETLRLLTITRALMPTSSDATTDVDPGLRETVRALMSGSFLK